MTKPRYWNVKQGTSYARVRADDMEGAKTRAAQMGFKNPDSIVLAYDLTLPAQPAPTDDKDVAAYRAKQLARKSAGRHDWSNASESERAFWRNQYSKANHS